MLPVRPVPPRATIAIGGISDPDARRVVLARQSVFRACYQRELARLPSLQGRLDVTLTIAGDGRVTDVMAGGSMTGPATQCVRGNLFRLRFPAGTTSSLGFPITFRVQ